MDISALFSINRQMTQEQLIARREELSAPIYQQILMTDDENDLLLLASSMLIRSFAIFINHYGVEAGNHLINELLNQVKNNQPT